MKTSRPYVSIYTVLLAVIVLTACKTEDPILTFSSADKGAYVKLISNSEFGSNTINITDQTSYNESKYGYSVEFIDGAHGTRILRYKLDVSYTDSTGTVTSAPVFFKTFETTSFSLSENNNLGVEDIEIEPSALAILFGLSFDDLKANAKFNITGTLITFDNKSFGSVNSSPTINGDAYFDYEMVVVK